MPDPTIETPFDSGPNNFAVPMAKQIKITWPVGSLSGSTERHAITLDMRAYRFLEGTLQVPTQADLTVTAKAYAVISESETDKANGAAFTFASGSQLNPGQSGKIKTEPICSTTLCAVGGTVPKAPPFVLITIQPSDTVSAGPVTLLLTMRR